MCVCVCVMVLVVLDILAKYNQLFKDTILTYLLTSEVSDFNWDCLIKVKLLIYFCFQDNVFILYKL